MTTTAGEPSTGSDKLPPRRSRRLFALPSGVVMVLAIFMPVVKVCGNPTYPIQMPLVWGPYVLGGLVIAMALADRARGLRMLVIMAQIVIALQWGGFGILMFGASDHGGTRRGGSCSWPRCSASGCSRGAARPRPARPTR